MPSDVKPQTNVAVRRVLGQPIACVDYEGAVAQVTTWAHLGDRAYAVEAANTHVVTLARHNPEFSAAMAKFDLILPDGMPLVWSINRQLPVSEQLKDRVYGPTFMLRCLEATAGTSAQGHFLLGGSPELLETLQERLRARFPHAALAGAYSPPYGDWPMDEDARIMQRIAESGARYIWVGLGCPKQEYWISRHLPQLPAGVYFGIGAAFAFHAGRVKQAPAWFQSHGLEWLHRMITEPRRLLRRYAVYNSLFIYYSALEKLRRKSAE